MTDITHSYPFDPRGDKASNLITAERHVLSPPAWKDYHFIIPKLAPFFRGSLVLRHLDTGRELVEGVDWLASHRFIDASRATAKPIYGSITLFDKKLTGVVELVSYQTLGGDWTIDGDTITQILVQKHSNPRITTWEEVVDVPFQFPVIDHEYDLADLVGMSEVREAIDSVADAISINSEIGPTVNNHLANRNNPHQVSKMQVGLGNVEDLPIATRAEALEGMSDSAYMTPRRTRQASERIVEDAISQHVNSDTNPHQVTKAQVGLSRVENLPLADLPHAQDGIGDASYMTPRLTKAAIDSQIRGPHLEHVANRDNPHRVTKAQVGLGNVQNLGLATKGDAEVGERDDCYVTPLRVKQAIARFSSDAISGAVVTEGRQHFYTKTEVDTFFDNIGDQLELNPADVEAALGNTLPTMVNESVNTRLDAILGPAVTNAVSTALAANLGPVVDDAVTAAIVASLGNAVQSAVAQAILTTIGPMIDERISDAMERALTVDDTIDLGQTVPSTGE